MSNIPEGYCQCGCGGKTRVPTVTNERTNQVAGRPLKYINGHNSPARRIKPVVVEAGYKDPCWLWPGALGEEGYGYASFDGRMRRVHRVYYEAERGLIPQGKQLDHLCKNRACCNPQHMEVVSNAENSRRGASTKLTWEDVAEIRDRSKDGETRTRLAKEFGVSRQHILRIVNGSAWRKEA